MNVTWNEYNNVRREIESIKKSGMYGHYIVDDDDKIIGEVIDGKYFNDEVFYEQVIKPNERYHIYLLPKKIEKEVRKKWSHRTIAEINQGVNKARWLQAQEKSKYKLWNKIELDVLLEIQEIYRVADVIEDYCKNADPVIRFQEFFRIDKLRREINRFMKKAGVCPQLKSKQGDAEQCTLEIN